MNLEFFIRRPVLSTVISILIFSVGLAALFSLPIEQYPPITPPTVRISAIYPGADAETVASSVATPIEQELSGIKGLIYYQSAAGNDGSLGITATFEIGTDLDIAAVEVQNRISRAEARLPQEVLRQGLTVSKASDSMLAVASLRSHNPDHDNLFLANYAQINMVDTIRRVPGIGNATVFGANDYAMKLWLNPDLLTARQLTIGDIVTATSEQNAIYAAGNIGGEPIKNNRGLTMPVTTPGRFQSAEEFQQIILRANPDGSQLRLRDVAEVELSARGYSMEGRQNGEPSALIVTYLQPDANALSAADGFQNELRNLSRNFPEGMYFEIAHDTTPFITAGIKEVQHTFLEAGILVSLVVLIFLGTWRATIIPLLAVPVSIVGALAFFSLLGFSINTLTLLALVLAIGIVVDDAIIVVENVERLMTERKMAALPATIEAMKQVGGPLVAIVLVLSAVFIPVAFLGGVTGELYRQFAITIASSVLISGLVALTLTPALAAILLRKGHGKKVFVFRWFDSAFGVFTNFYQWMIRWAIRFGFVTVLAFAAMIYGIVYLFQTTPTGFIPQEDQGYFIVALMLPPGAALDRTRDVVAEVESFLLAQEEVRATVALVGIDLFSGFTPKTSSSVIFCRLKTWDERPGAGSHASAVVGRVFGAFAAKTEAMVIPIIPPPVQGLGFRAGFELQLQDRTGGNLEDFGKVAGNFLAALSSREEVSNVINPFDMSSPQLRTQVDLQLAKLRGVGVDEVYKTLQALLGTLYVNDFTYQGRIFQVQLGTREEWRDDPQDIKRIFVRNHGGSMVPLSELIDTSFMAGPSVVNHFNGFPSIQMTGEPGRGFSTGQAMQIAEEVAQANLPLGYTIEWSGSSFQERKVSSEAFFVIGGGLFVIFLLLCALYERWALPFAVLLGVPAGIFGALVALKLRGLPMDIYFQVGLLTLIGLAAKNAILIVEFASTLREGGMSIIDSAVEAARVRLRPFVMTSLAFILGTLPLFLASGAGAAGRQSIGTAVMGGMIAATLLDMLFVPVLFAFITWASETTNKQVLGRIFGREADSHGHTIVPEEIH